MGTALNVQGYTNHSFENGCSCYTNDIYSKWHIAIPPLQWEYRSQESGVRSLLFTTTDNIALNNDGDTSTTEIM